MERVCEHGICHDAPDDLAYRRSVGAEATGAHGCCVPSCCGIEPEREQVTVPESRAVVVVDYQAGWPARFEELRAAYARALEKSQVPYRSIEHVGSTSVPGLAAKPVIDVDIVVDEPDVDAATAALEQIGFISRGDLGVSGRYAFVTPERFAPTNTYAAIEGALALRNHLAVRDVLRADPALRDEYAQVKRHAAEVAVDIDEYISLKSEFLGRVLERAGLSEADRAAIAETNRGIAGRGAHG
ncbi:protein of unknown function UPF0157 [Gulosibacter sp. 10]|nr:protein of unknown function UPF0157 [Gulosibacter sp. 10]